jgi:hypothetical protein
MKKFFFRLRFKNMLVMSILSGCLLGIFDTLAVSTYGDETDPTVWKCPIPSITVNGNSCSASGCSKKGGRDGYWVCNYVGQDCPPLEACENNSGGGES